MKWRRQTGHARRTSHHCLGGSPARGRSHRSRRVCMLHMMLRGMPVRPNFKRQHVAPRYPYLLPLPAQCGSSQVRTQT